MKSRYIILVPIILLGLLLIPLVLVRNEISKKRAPAVAAGETSPAPADYPDKAVEPVPAPAPVPTPPPYTTATPSPDGIGKIFMGREISHVMGHPGIGWLERSDREKEEAPSKAIALLGLAPDTVIADIGAGSGYYSFRIAPLIPEGKVIAVDIQPEMLRYLRFESKRLGTTNVEPHLGAIDDIKLPPDTIDAALMVDAYHEFSHPAEMLQSLHKALRPGGRIYLLEYRAEDPEVPIKRLHKMTEAQARKEFKALGFKFVENKPGLPWQHLLVFEKPQTSKANSNAADYILNKLETIKIPRVDFENATAEEALDFLRLRAVELDGAPPERRGISMVIRNPRGVNRPDDGNSLSLGDPIAAESKTFSLTLRDVSVIEALKAIAEKANLDIYLTTRALLITPAGSIPSPASDPEILSTIYSHRNKTNSPTDH